MLDQELLRSLVQRWPCRETQLSQLNSLFSHASSPSIIVGHGPKATGKTSIVQAFIAASKLDAVTVSCHECVTERQLLQRTLALALDKVQASQTNGTGSHATSKCETVSALQAMLEPLLAQSSKFILVLDGTDELSEANPALLAAFSRLNERIPNLVLLLLVRNTPPRFLRRPGVLFLPFHAYTREQTIHIVSQRPLDIFLELPSANKRYNAAIHEEDKQWLWPRFVAAVWDSLGHSVARNLVDFRDVCERLWRPFIQPVINGELGTRDFSRLMVSQRSVFQDEGVLLNGILESATSETIHSSNMRMQNALPYYSKWLLTAAFLASMNPPKLDAIYFMKSTDKKRRKRAGAVATKASKQRKIPRHLLSPSPFNLSRLLAILRAILPDPLRSSMDLQTQIASLTSLRLLARSSGYGSGDAIETGGKWKIGPAVTWDFASSLAGSLDFVLSDYLAT